MPCKLYMQYSLIASQPFSILNFFFFKLFYLMVGIKSFKIMHGSLFLFGDETMEVLYKINISIE